MTRKVIVLGANEVMTCYGKGCEKTCRCGDEMVYDNDIRSIKHKMFCISCWNIMFPDQRVTGYD